ncbi:YfhO family protein [Listeria sp. PSOL-1]|uniref:YfhO family protein n=1 Tax=Listeria sp. PSOL-1 TaxID=1844999 RepID=UPI0013D2F2BE|nr:YfhO family protein [Listeria sp. PSOL-1]
MIYSKFLAAIKARRFVLLRSAILFFFICLILYLQIYIFWGTTDIRIGDDLYFHINRIMGLKDAIAHATFPFYINQYFLNGYGYGVNWFYPEWFLYPFAYALNLGVSFAVAYKCWLILVGLGSFYSMYGVILRLSGNRFAAILSGILYISSSYKLVDTFQRAALGEVLSFIFFPIVLYGIYTLFYQKERKASPLIWGMLGLIASHILSVMMGAFVILFFLFCFICQKGAKKKAFLLLLAAGVSTLCISALIWMPLLEQWTSQRFLFQIHSFITPDSAAYSFSSFIESLTGQNAGVGILLFLGILIFSIALIKRRRGSRFEWHCLLLMGLLLVMTTQLFPWKSLSFLDILQFPWRLNLMITVLACFLVGLNWEKVVENIPKFFHLHALVFLAVCAFFLQLVPVVSAYHQSTIGQLKLVSVQKEIEAHPNDLGAGQEYLPENASLSSIAATKQIETLGKVNLSNQKRITQGYQVHYQDAQNASIIFPLLYYKGYTIQQNGKNIPIHPIRGQVSCVVQGSGDLKVVFTGTFIQHFSFWFSFCSLLFWGIYANRRIAQRSRLDI